MLIPANLAIALAVTAVLYLLHRMVPAGKFRWWGHLLMFLIAVAFLLLMWAGVQV